ncbi:MAG: response regulator transcription factor [Kiloniellales bacterium]|nr:response regulator transcription factor [Kiloniellales bacterium]MDJ0969760.1 response regulator transcription factor [Kiloniellales bacterium]MDJ0982233.1 response regulator transcription factor [Kiloniellales bacterium]
MRIALVEDNEMLADGIAKALGDEGHGIDLLQDGEQADDYLKSDSVDLIILDLALPGLDGLEVLKRLRQRGNATPVLVLTARGDLGDRIKGLDVGADDYLVKPFEMAELEARVRALLRRASARDSLEVALRRLRYDRAARRAFVDEAEIRLPMKELSLLECLLDRQGQIVSKETIADHLYGAGSDVDVKVIELYVHRLRKRLVQAEVGIRTVRGLGYIIE